MLMLDPRRAMDQDNRMRGIHRRVFSVSQLRAVAGNIELGLGTPEKSTVLNGAATDSIFGTFLPGAMAIMTARTITKRLIVLRHLISSSVA